MQYAEQATAFGEQLIRTYDLDPVYVMLNLASLEEEQLQRWCLVYWLAYRVDVATMLCDAKPFWPKVTEFLLRPASPRGSERRHYRGSQAARSLAWLQAAYPNPQTMVGGLATRTGWSGTIDLVRSWLGFGEWIAFKVADMASIVLEAPWQVDESQVHDSFYSGVVQAAELITGKKGDGVVLGAAAGMWPLRGLMAPHWGPWPRSPRPINIQELETCMCKFKSHLSGHYPVGKDTREVLHALESVQDRPLGKRFKDALKSLPQPARPREGLLGVR